MTNSRRITRKQVWNEHGLNSRYLVVQALHDSSIKALPTERIHILANKHNISGQDFSFAYDLLCGVIKMRLTLDLLIQKLADRQPKTIQPRLLTILRMGIYQLLFDDSVPEFAAIDTSCKLTAIFGGKKQVGFVNAVLRTIQKHIADKETKIDDSQADYILPKTLSSGVKFDKKILPAIDNIDNFYSKAYSYPKWLVKKWFGRWNAETVKEIWVGGNFRPTIVVRANRVKFPTNPAEMLIEYLKKENCEVVKVEDSDCFVRFISGPPITKLDAFKEGLFQVQDVTSGALAENIKLKSGMRILDLCAGLGTKTTQIAEKLNDNAEIFATDTDRAKLEKLKENAQRLGLKSIKIINYDKVFSGKYDKSFDVIILDVPCTNTGVLDRRAEARWRISENDLKEFPKMSINLLEKALRLSKPDGIIGFSTCSIEKEENQDVIEKFSKTYSCKILKQSEHLPKIDNSRGRTISTGGYWAVLTK